MLPTCDCPGKSLKAKLADGIDVQLREELEDFASHFESLPEAIAARNELDAARRLRHARDLMQRRTASSGMRLLQEIVRMWPDTHAAAEAMRTFAQAKERWDLLKAELDGGVNDQLREKLNEFSATFDGLPEAVAAKNEIEAAAKLRLASQLIGKGNTATGEHWLRDLIVEWPETQAAKEAHKALGNDETPPR